MVRRTYKSSALPRALGSAIEVDLWIELHENQHKRAQMKSCHCVSASCSRWRLLLARFRGQRGGGASGVSSRGGRLPKKGHDTDVY